jgi:hypothetical protein
VTELRTGDARSVNGVRDWPLAVWLAGGVFFLILATANGAGYRYGVSDQAFYVPAVVHTLNPSAFPRDGALIDAQGRLMVGDEVLATAATITGLPLDWLFLAAYVVSIGLLWLGIVLIGRRMSLAPWAIVALAAASTLRHRIPRTSANSLEPYFHPRMLAFALGVLAIAAVLQRRRWVPVLLVAAAASIHVTTAIWFAILIGVALMVLDPVFRRLGLVGGAAVLAALAWALVAGPLRSSLTTMDAVWLEALASKDSLFATEWPLWAWVVNLAGFVLLCWAYRRRAALGLATREELALVAGAGTLVFVFLTTLPLVAAGFALPVQLQISRVFWLVEFVAIVFVIGAAGAPAATRAHLLAALLMAVAIGRGAYIMLVEQPERPLFAVHLAESPWHDAMRWLRTTPLAAHVLADPGHAWKYGTSVRVAAERDVFLEDVKDSAIAIYSRDVAARVVERARALGPFEALTAARAQALAAQYDLDFLVTTSELPLDVAYRNAQFRVYRLR